MTLGDKTVSIVVVNYNGRRHLRDCFESLQRLEYPADQVELICVDNASSDGSLEFLRDSFRDVRVLENETNLGFAAGCNAGAREASGEFLAFVNNDMKVDAGWLRGLMAPIDKDAGIVASAGRILTWDGRDLDFGRGAVNFHGNASQVGTGSPASLFIPTEEELLFPCGGSMLIDRGTFLEVGGFDDDYFAFFEDVDLGWRLWVLGYQVKSAADAVAFHRVHATGGRFSQARLRHLYEQNALATVIKNVEERHLGAILSAALLLLVRRATLVAGLKPGAFTPAGTSDDEVKVPEEALAILAGADDIIETMPSLLKKRAWIQERRRRSDEQIFSLFNRPFRPQGRIESYLMAQASVIRTLGIEELFPEREAGLILVVGLTSPEFQDTWVPRATSIAETLSVGWEVTFAGLRGLVGGRFHFVDCAEEPARLMRLLDFHEVVLLHAGYWEGNPSPAGHILVVDLSDVPLDEGSPRWLQEVGRAGDVFLLEDEDRARAWSGLLTRWNTGHPEEAVIAVERGAGPSAMAPIVDVCRNPHRVWAARGRRRLSRYTDEVEVLLSDWSKRILGLEDALRRVQSKRMQAIDRALGGFSRFARRLARKLPPFMQLWLRALGRMLGFKG